MPNDSESGNTKKRNNNIIFVTKNNISFTKNNNFPGKMHTKSSFYTVLHTFTHFFCDTQLTLEDFRNTSIVFPAILWCARGRWPITFSAINIGRSPFPLYFLVTKGGKKEKMVRD